MARIPMVTRTLTTTKAVCLCLNVETADPYNETYVMPRTYKDKDALVRAIQEKHNTDTCKVVTCVDVEEIETLYGMSESDFVKYAKVLPPRTAKSAATGESQDGTSTTDGMSAPEQAQDEENIPEVTE